MPEAAPAPIENPYLRALEVETMWWLTEGMAAGIANPTAVSLHENRFREELHAAVHYEGQAYERARGIHLESQAERLIVGALKEFIRHPSRQWHVQPPTHWARARRFIVTLPSTLDAVWEWGGRPPSLNAEAVRLWLKENIIAICPYICPA
jgi:hypothetical protein